MNFKSSLKAYWARLKENSVILGWWFKDENPHWRISIVQMICNALHPEPLSLFGRMLTFIPKVIITLFNDFIYAPILSVSYSTLDKKQKYEGETYWQWLAREKRFARMEELRSFFSETSEKELIVLDKYISKCGVPDVSDQLYSGFNNSIAGYDEVTSAQIAWAKIYFESTDITHLSRKSEIAQVMGIKNSMFFDKENNLLYVKEKTNLDRKTKAIISSDTIESPQNYLGQGGSGRVKTAQSENGGELRALKIFAFTFSDKNKEQAEIRVSQNIMRILNKLFFTFKKMTNTKKAFFKGNKEKTYEVLQLNEGKDFYERLVDLGIVSIQGNSMTILLEKSRISIDSRIHTILEIFYDVQRHHAQGIVHGDISAENIKEHSSKLELIDYGFSKLLSGEKSVQTDIFVYKKDYGAPEIVNKGIYSLASDIYALAHLIRYHFFSEKELNQPNLKPLKDILDQMGDRPSRMSHVSIPIQYRIGTPENRPDISSVIKVFEQFLIPVVPRPPVIVRRPQGFQRLSLPSFIPLPPWWNKPTF